MSYQDTTSTWVFPSGSGETIVWVASNREPNLIPTISLDTISSSLYPKDSVVAAFIAALISSLVTALSTTANRRVVDPVGVGTRCAAPISLPFSSGITRPIAFAAPVLFGTMLTAPARLLLRSPFLCGPSRII